MEERRSIVPALRGERITHTSLPLLGQQLSTIMAHGVARAGGTRRRIRWTLTRRHGARLVPLATPIEREGHRPSIAMVTFDDDTTPPLLVDAFETALVDGAETETAVPELLRHGFDAEIRPVEAAFGAIRRLVEAGILVRDPPH